MASDDEGSNPSCVTYFSRTLDTQKMSQTYKSCTALDLLRTSVDPTRYNTIPPAYCTQTTFSKKIDVQGNFLINDSSTNIAAAGEKVLTGTGVVLWMPNRGLNTCYRFGIVPAGTNSYGIAQGGVITPATSSIGGIPYFLGSFNPVANSLEYMGASTTNSSVPSLYFGSPLPVPYNNQSNTDILTFSPPITPQNFAMSRLYAGTLKATQGTVGIGLTASPGYFTAAAISDIRDVFQNFTPQTGITEGGGPTAAPTGFVVQSTDSAFSQAQLVQSSMTVKDSAKEVSGGDGVVVLQGPDINDRLNVPNVSTIACQNGTLWQSYPIPQANLRFGGTLTGPAVYPLFVAWASPWNVFDNTIRYATQSLTTMQIITPYSINPVGGCLQFEVNLGLEFPNMVPQTLTINFLHVFVTCSSNGELYYNTWYETGAIYSTTDTTQASFSPVNNLLRAESNPKKFMTYGFNQYNPGTGSLAGHTPNCGGMYLGTQIIAFTQIYTTAMTPIVAIQALDSYVNVRAVNDFDTPDGELGSCRVIRWDGMNAATTTQPINQQIRIDGTFLAECIPGLTTAPFVQTGGNMSRACDNLNAVPFLSFCYNTDDSPFKRVWTAVDWVEYKLNILPSFNCHDLRAFAGPRLLHCAAAAGVLKAVSCEEEEGPHGGGSRGGGSASAAGTWQDKSVAYPRKRAHTDESHIDMSDYGVRPSQASRQRQREDMLNHLEVTTANGATAPNAYAMKNGSCSPMQVNDRLASLDKAMMPIALAREKAQAKRKQKLDTER